VVFGRKPPRTQSQQLMDELTESSGHLKQAAGHMAGGTAEKLTPPYDRARGAAARGLHTTVGVFSPLYEQMKVGAANARREYEMPRKNRWPAVVGILAAGAAVGAAGAMVVRRRRAAAQWDEYDPMPAVSELPYGSGMPTTGDSKVSSATSKVTAGAASVADSVSNQAGKIAGSLHEKAKGPEGPEKASEKGSAKPSKIDDEP
jgi:hypothetical protein